MAANVRRTSEHTEPTTRRAARHSLADRRRHPRGARATATALILLRGDDASVTTHDPAAEPASAPVPPIEKSGVGEPCPAEAPRANPEPATAYRASCAT